MQSDKIFKLYSYLVMGVIAVAVASGSYFWKSSTRKALESNALEMEKESLLIEKGVLAAQLEALQNTCASVMAENALLKGTVNGNKLSMYEMQAHFENYKHHSTGERINLDELKNEVFIMQQDKICLENDILALMNENQLIKATNEQLKYQLKKAKEENSVLNNKVEELAVLQQNLKSWQEASAPGGLHANGFRVEVEKRNNKLTVMGKNARHLVISFDLMEVPSQLYGVQSLYLSITDNKGTPVKGQQNTSVSIGTAEKLMDIISQQTKEISLHKSQRISFNYPLEQKLAAGYYRAAVYMESGWIGSVSFKVS